MFRKWLIGLFSLLLASIMGCWYLYYSSGQEAEYEQANMLREKWVGKAFPLNDITDLDGRPVTRKIFKRKKYTVVDVWFAGCSPCIKEMKNFPAYLSENPDLQIVSLSVDPLSLQKRILTGQSNLLETKAGRRHETAQVTGQQAGKSALSFLAKQHDGWHHVNKEATTEQYANGQGLDVWMYPTYFLVDAEGKVLDRYQVFSEYSYSTFMKFIRDKAYFLYFLILSKDAFLTFLAISFLFYLLGSGLLVFIRRAIQSGQV